MPEMKEAVRERYARLATQLAVVDGAGACCTPAYDDAELAAAGLSTGISLGCGNPTTLAELRPGDRVLDLGSGGGLDVLLSARRVGPTGHAYGVDMTDEMLALAERNRAAAGVANASFLRGAIEAVPLPEGAVDVVISNCVVNLAEDKGAVLREAFRVLRPGGRVAIADMVEIETLPEDLKRELDAWAGCIAGTIPVDEYRELLDVAGFTDIEIDVHDVQKMDGGIGSIGSAHIRAVKPHPDAG